MINKTVLILLVFFTLSCTKDDKLTAPDLTPPDDEIISPDSTLVDDEIIPPSTTPPVCLDEMVLSVGSSNCSNLLFGNNCQKFFADKKGIPNEFKSYFSDFCNPLESVINFKNEEGKTIEARVEEKKYETDSYAIVASYGEPDCKLFCMENEVATIVLASEKFSLEINFLTGLNDDINEDNLDENFSLRYSIFAKFKNTAQHIFSLEVANAANELVEPDTSYIRYHENIELVGSIYSNIYSNENLDVPGLVRKEKVYFHNTDGIIAIRDSTGVLWRKD